MGIRPNSAIDFSEKDGKLSLTKRKISKPRRDRFASFRGVATVKMSTDDIIVLPCKNFFSRKKFLTALVRLIGVQNLFC